MDKLKKYLSRLFIDGLSGMALGLFSTLIIGTILKQIGVYAGGVIGRYLIVIGMTAQLLTGAGIGVGVAIKLKRTAPLCVVGAAVSGLIGAYASRILAGGFYLAEGNHFDFSAPGEPLGAFIAAYVAIEIGGLVSGKTPVDIIVTPLCAILSGSVVGLLLGPPISAFMMWLGNLVNINVSQHPILGGIGVSALMGVFLTLPISSAAIGISMGLTGVASGAATAGCCAHMIGFAVASYRENRIGGLVAQGIGTSMLQMPNLVRRPILWLPAVITSVITGPIAALLGMVSDPVGSGMGTAGLVGPISAFTQMTGAGISVPVTLAEIGIVYFLLPAAIALAVSELMRKLNLIRQGDLKLEL